MKNLLAALVLTAATFSTPVLADEALSSEALSSEAPSSEALNETEALGLWRCDAWYVYNPYYNWYWIGPNLAYSRSQALGACQLNFGVYCQYRCSIY